MVVVAVVAYLMMAYLIDEIKVFDDGTICTACRKLYVRNPM